MKCNKQLFIYIIDFPRVLFPGENQGITGAVLKDAVLIIIRKAEVTPAV
jgi:hypothetical protein